MINVVIANWMINFPLHLYDIHQVNSLSIQNPYSFIKTSISHLFGASKTITTLYVKQPTRILICSIHCVSASTLIHNGFIIYLHEFVVVFFFLFLNSSTFLIMIHRSEQIRKTETTNLIINLQYNFNLNFYGNVLFWPQKVTFQNIYFI